MGRLRQRAGSWVPENDTRTEGERFRSPRRTFRFNSLVSYASGTPCAASRLTAIAASSSGPARSDRV